MEDLSPEQLAELKVDLLDLQTSLRETLAVSVDAARPVQLDQQAMGRVSRIDAIQQQKMVQANRQRAQLRLNRIQAALRAMEEDEYGLCRLCDEPIMYGRLKARPEAAICLDCQARREKNQ
jgi:DnaK suppressor protein